MKSKIVVGNWKMNGDMSSVSSFARDIVGEHQVELALAVPATLITPAVLCMPEILIGAQDVASTSDGPFTGSISAAMMREAGACFTIVGHSERRIGLGDDDAKVKAKVRAALQVGLRVLLCVGDRSNSGSPTENNKIVNDQLLRCLPDLSLPSALMVAYEPVSAIGTGVTSSINEIEDVLDTLRESVRSRIGDDVSEIRFLYGGSVNASNAREISGISGLDGLLVGRSSLSVPEFLRVASAASS